jgi:hypothetical protein
LTTQQDLSQRVVLEGTHYIAIGEHADLWIGIMSDKKVCNLLITNMRRNEGVDPLGCGEIAPRWLLQQSRFPAKIQEGESMTRMTWCPKDF